MRRRLEVGFGAAVAIGIALSGPRVAGLPRTPQSQIVRPAPPASMRPMPAMGTGAISGAVSDALTGEPIGGATVSLIVFAPGSPAPPIERPSVVTDARGRFVFRDLPASNGYYLGVRAPGYASGGYGRGAPDSKTYVLVEGRSAGIDLADGQWIRDANVKLWRLGAIGGRVLDEQSEPVVGVAVRAYLTQFIVGVKQLVAGPLTITDDRGVYRLPDLAPAPYVVCVLSVQATVPATVADAPPTLPLGGLETGGFRGAGPEIRAPSIDVDGRHRLVLTAFATPPPPASARSRAYPPVCYPNAQTAADAQAVTLDYGTSRAGVDFQLAPVPAVRVSGQVTGEIAHAPGMVLRLMPAGEEQLGFGAEVATTLVEADGTFTFLNVPAGNYTIVAAPSVVSATAGDSPGRLPAAAGFAVDSLSVGSFPAAPGVQLLTQQSKAGGSTWGRAPVSVGGGDVSGVTLVLHRGASVQGHVAFDGTSAIPSQRVSVRLQPASGDAAFGLLFGATSPDDATHAFTIDGLLGGRYLVPYQFFAGWRLKSVTSNGVDVTDTGFDGLQGVDFDDVVVTLTDRAAELNGTITDEGGRPAYSSVILFPVDRAGWTNYGWTPDRLRATSAGSSGAYSFKELRDGDYYVIAVPHTQQDLWVNPAFLAAAAPLATPVTLTAGSPKTQDLRVQEVTIK